VTGSSSAEPQLNVPGSGAAVDLFELNWGGGGVSEFCQVIKANFAKSPQPLINIYFRSGGAQHQKYFFRTTYFSIYFVFN
jgi:hypothetical protein